MRLGGGTRLSYEPAAFAVAFDPSVTELGWRESRDYVTVSQETAETQVRAPLLRHGIRVP